MLDALFWRDFWSGPPAAGLFAVVGALIAYAAARVGARTARQSSERAEWWKRAEWALTLAGSEVDTVRLVGCRALEALRPDATAIELSLIEAVTTELVYPADSD